MQTSICRNVKSPSQRKTVSIKNLPTLNPPSAQPHIQRFPPPQHPPDPLQHFPILPPLSIPSFDQLSNVKTVPLFPRPSFFPLPSHHLGSSAKSLPPPFPRSHSPPPLPHHPPSSPPPLHIIPPSYSSLSSRRYFSRWTLFPQSSLHTLHFVRVSSRWHCHSLLSSRPCARALRGACHFHRI